MNADIKELVTEAGRNRDPGGPRVKDYSKEVLESSRPQIVAYEAVDFCIRQLYADRRHKLDDEVARRLTYEELIGALLAARDELE